VVSRHLIGSDLAGASNHVAVCPVDIGVDCWGEAVAVAPRARECRLWRHWFQLTSVQAVKRVSNRPFAFLDPQLVSFMLISGPGSMMTANIHSLLSSQI
jgi:hypothetical protein